MDTEQLIEQNTNETETLTQQIERKLKEGYRPSQLIDQGYNRNTVYSVRRGLISRGDLSDTGESEEQGASGDQSEGENTGEDKGETEEQPEPGLKGVTPTGMIQYTVTLPPEAFTYYNLAMAWDFDGNNGKYKPFDVWLFECITKRFEKDYKMQLVLAPLEEGQ